MYIVPLHYIIVLLNVLVVLVWNITTVPTTKMSLLNAVCLLKVFFLVASFISLAISSFISKPSTTTSLCDDNIIVDYEGWSSSMSCTNQTCTFASTISKDFSGRSKGAED